MDLGRKWWNRGGGREGVERAWNPWKRNAEMGMDRGGFVG